MKPVIAIILAALVAGCLIDSERLERADLELASAADAENLSSPAESERARPTTKYDGSWHMTKSWGGEWPHGFTVTRHVTIKIRAALGLDTPKSVACFFRKGATFHPWNKKRIASDRLEFVTFTRIETYELKESFTAQLMRESGNETVELKKGDRWHFLGGIAEGEFILKVGNADYTSSQQELFEKSTQVDARAKGAQGADDGIHEWLKLKCANGAVGWIFLDEVRRIPAISVADMTCGYGCASDLDPRPKSGSGQ
jgi:hypothetical protein